MSEGPLRSQGGLGVNYFDGSMRTFPFRILNTQIRSPRKRRLFMEKRPRMASRTSYGNNLSNGTSDDINLPCRTSHKPRFSKISFALWFEGVHQFGVVQAFELQSYNSSTEKYSVKFAFRYLTSNGHPLATPSAIGHVCRDIQTSIFNCGFRKHACL